MKLSLRGSSYMLKSHKSAGLLHGRALTACAVGADT